MCNGMCIRIHCRITHSCPLTTPYMYCYTLRSKRSQPKERCKSLVLFMKKIIFLFSSLLLLSWVHDGAAATRVARHRSLWQEFDSGDQQVTLSTRAVSEQCAVVRRARGDMARTLSPGSIRATRTNDSVQRCEH